MRLQPFRRRDVDLDVGSVYVRRSRSERSTGERVEGPPKSRAGVRVVALPRAIVDALAEHVATFTRPASGALVFTGDKGGALRRSNDNKQTRWTDAVVALGVEGLHFHDLRHTGNHVAAQTGASLPIARRVGTPLRNDAAPGRKVPLTWGFRLERVTVSWLRT